MKRIESPWEDAREATGECVTIPCKDPRVGFDICNEPWTLCSYSVVVMLLSTMSLRSRHWGCLMHHISHEVPLRQQSILGKSLDKQPVLCTGLETSRQGWVASLEARHTRVQVLLSELSSFSLSGKVIVFLEFQFPWQL